MDGLYWYFKEGYLVVFCFLHEKNDDDWMTFDYSLSVNKRWYYHSKYRNGEGHLRIRATEQ